MLKGTYYQMSEKMSQKEKNIFQLARIIAASLKGNANDEEQRTLREWLSVSTRNKKIYDEFKDGKRLEQEQKDENDHSLRGNTHSPDRGGRYFPTPKEWSANYCLYFRSHQAGRA